jgi:hypothetical protein
MTTEGSKLIESLDDEWIKRFEEEDRPYEDFYKEDNYYLNVHFLYINDKNSLEEIKQEKFFMTIPNYIMREELIYLLKKNMHRNNKRYTLFSLLKYHMTLDPNEIKKYLSEKENDSNRFFSSIKNLDTLFFEKTISTFQDLNSLFFVLREKSSVSNTNGIVNGNTKNNNTTSSANLKQTKKVYLQQLQRKNKRGTRRV